MKDNQLISLVKEYAALTVLIVFACVIGLAWWKPEFITILMGQLVAGIFILSAAWFSVWYVHLPENIEKRAKAEVKEKLKIENILEIIEGTEKCENAVYNLAQYILEFSVFISIKYNGVDLDTQRMKAMPDMQAAMELITTSRSVQGMLSAAALKISKGDNNREIEKFVFSLEKYMLINGEDAKIAELTDKIKDAYRRMMRSFSIDAEGEDGKAILNKLNENMIVNMENIHHTVKEALRGILQIYTRKLASQHEK